MATPYWWQGAARNEAAIHFRLYQQAKLGGSVCRACVPKDRLLSSFPPTKCFRPGPQRMRGGAVRRFASDRQFHRGIQVESTLAGIQSVEATLFKLQEAVRVEFQGIVSCHPALS